MIAQPNQDGLPVDAREKTRSQNALLYPRGLVRMFDTQTASVAADLTCLTHRTEQIICLGSLSWTFMLPRLDMQQNTLAHDAQVD